LLTYQIIIVEREALTKTTSRLASSATSLNVQRNSHATKTHLKNLQAAFKSTMSKANALSASLKSSSPSTLNTPKAAAPQAAKRKYATNEASISDLEGISEDEPPKKQKTIKKGPAKKTPPKKAAAKKAEGGDKAAGQLYKKTIGDVDKKVSILDAAVKKMGPNGRSVTSDTYADTMVPFAKDLRKLMVMGQEGAKLAFNLVLYIGPHMHGDLDASCEMSGYGEAEDSFAEMDELMLEIIGLREDVDGGEDAALPQIKHRWTREDADVGVFKTGRPNKQQRGQIERQKAKWTKERNDALRQRREKAGVDWISIGISELKDEHQYIRAYGLNGYFSKTLAKLEAMQAGRK
jgi:hypothetical protein